MEQRNWDDPEYKAWRLAVYKRDKFTCRFSGCRSTRGINAHHIRRWADFPELRFVVSNGITLCKKHHGLVTGKEDDYMQMFLLIISGSNFLFEMIAARYKRDDSE
jgi:hypothetical protein